MLVPQPLEPKYLDPDELWLAVNDCYERYWEGKSQWFKNRYGEKKILERIAQEMRIPVHLVEDLLTQ